MSTPATTAPDREVAPVAIRAVLATATALCCAVAGRAAADGLIPEVLGASAAGAVAVGAVLGLRSLSIRLVARVLTGVSGVVLVRFGFLEGAIIGGGRLVLIWMVAAIGVLVLTDRLTPELAPSVDRSEPSASPLRAMALARTVVAVAVLVLVAVVALVPAIVDRIGRAVEPGQGATLDPTQGGAGALRASDSLDMTQRPELTDAVVFTVDAEAATFWRGQTFDVWDGQRWTRSDDRFTPLAGADRLQLPDDDLGARGSDVVEQRVRIEAPFADVVYAAPTPVQIQIDRPVRQRDDTTMVSAPMGRGATYTVTSRREPLSAERLRAAGRGETPAEVSARWAQDPVATDRVRALAAELDAGATSPYDTIEAIQDWMGSRIEYTIDAPLSPPGRDVVDHFLFEAEQGWCEQIASSLVVLARLNQIPARLVTGFVPAERDPLTGVFTVRERDAHAWAEVWFPEVGWVPFDPTADVPLAGEDQGDPTIAAWLAEDAVVLMLAVAALALVAGPVRAAVQRRRRARSDGPVGWAAHGDRRLDALGKAIGRPRAPAETATAYGSVLADRYHDPRLVAVGRLIDDALFAPAEPDPSARALVQDVLAEHEAAGAPSGELVAAGRGPQPRSSEHR
jgi:transglutaminase-like putative cysteine protease